jgi:hypothetical protein
VMERLSTVGHDDVFMQTISHGFVGYSKVYHRFVSMRDGMLPFYWLITCIACTARFCVPAQPDLLLVISQVAQCCWMQPCCSTY